MENSREYKGPDAAIHALCLAVEGFSPIARRIWDASRKEFDVGYEFSPSEHSARVTLRPHTVERMAMLGAGLAVTCYHKQ